MSISSTRGDIYIEFMSKDITNQSGAFAAILKKCYIGSFSNRVYKNNVNGGIKVYKKGVLIL